MKKHLLLIPVVAALLAPVGVSQAAPPAQAAPAQAQPRVVQGPVPTMKKASKMTTKAAAAVPGETRNVEATLTLPNGETPIAGKAVSFKFEGKSGNTTVIVNLGSASTNAQGKATVAWKVPELAQAAYTLKASFAGDDDTFASNDDANFGIIKAITKFDVSYNYGALDAHGGPLFGSLLVYVRRSSDNAPIDRTFHCTVNGVTTNYTTTNGNFVHIVLPNTTNTWNTKLVFDGDASYQAVQVDKTYSH